MSFLGPSQPFQPGDLTDTDPTHNSVTIRWIVSSLSYDPEIYVVRYGLAEDRLTLNSTIVMGDITPLNYMNSFTGSVQLTNLSSLTTYYYRVVAINSAGTTLSDVGMFNTSGIGKIHVHVNTSVC